MRAIAIINEFLMLAVASSLLCWIASLHPQALLLVRAAYAVFALLWVLSWILDDWVCAKLKTDITNLQGILVGAAFAALFGVGVMVCRF